MIDAATACTSALKDNPLIARATSRLRLEAGEYSRSLRESAGGLGLPEVSECDSSEIAENALTIIDSAYRADPLADRTFLLRFTIAISQRESLHSAIRLRAAEIGLVIAANMCEKDLASECFNGCGIVVADFETNVRAQRVGLLFHTVFGDRSLSRVLASKLLHFARCEPITTQQYHDFCRAGFAFRFSGSFDDVIAAFTNGFETAIELKLPRLAQYAAWQLSTVLLDAGIESRAHQWNAILENLFASDDDLVASSFVPAHLCRVAIHKREYKEAKKYLTLHARALPRRPVAVASSFEAALEIGVDLLDDGWCPTSEQLETALARHSRTASYVPSDFFTSVLLRALVRLRKVSDAEQLAQAYLTAQRRETLPLSMELSEALAMVRGGCG